jgi:CBS domain containing-hemolysin-like protein
MTVLIVAMVFVILLAALFASIEAAIFSTSLPKAQVLKKQGRLGSGSLVVIRENMSRPVTTLVIGTNIVTIVGSTLIGHLATETFGDKSIGLILAAVTFLIIIFGEIFPKVLGEHYSTPIALLAARPLLILTQILSPAIWIIEKSTSSFKQEGNVVSEEELKMLSEMGSEEGSIEQTEKELIQRIFTLNDLTAKDIMTPRMVIEGLPGERTLREVSVIILHKPYSRYPVFSGNIDAVVGIVQTKDLLIALSRDGESELVSHFMTTPLFVPEKKRVDDLLSLFLSSKKHMAIVQDDFGGTAGVVTFEDVLEQLVGEIVDESDEIVDLQSHARKRKHTRF